MLSIQINTSDVANELTNLCVEYRENYNINTDVVFGRYVIDGCSLLGVMSLMGHLVNIIPITNDKRILSDFSNDIISIGGCIKEEGDE